MAKEQRQASLPPEENPLVKLERAWRWIERISISASILLVAGTIGYVVTEHIA